MKYRLTQAPTTHTIKWQCPLCGVLNLIRVEHGDRMPTGLYCKNDDFETPVTGWTIELETPLDDLREIVVYPIPVHR